jgi:CDP-diacylglycerol--glycerol-3-phosphate 3-phosphatidyltransferase
VNLPNKLTVSRFGLTVLFLIAMFAEFPYCETVALFLFVIASITDWMDGAIARKHKLITNFGILMDPLADKILTCSAFIAFVDRGYLAGWVAIIIVARELAITGLRLLAAAKNVVLPAEALGKYKTISQIVAIIAVLVLHSYEQWSFIGRAIFGWEIAGKAWTAWFTPLSLGVAVILTFVSGAQYLWRNRRLFMTDL